MVFTCSETGDIHKRNDVGRLNRLINVGKRKIIVIISVSAVVLFTLLGIIYKAAEAPPKKYIKIMDKHVDLQVMNVHYTEVTDEGVKWEIKADSAQYRKKESIAIFKNPNIKLVMPDGREFVLTGSEGCLHEDTRNIEISGNINLVSNNGDQFKTDYVKYSGAEKRCYTDAHVSMKGARIQIEANGMSLSLKDEHLELLSGVKACLN